jgi:hypothetical protein
MAGPLLFDRVKETSITTGTGAFTLAGASIGYRTFAAVLSVGDTCPYCIAAQGGTEWEVGIGTLSASTTLARTTVLASSNGGSAVNFSAGAKNVFLTYPAGRAVMKAASLTSARIPFANSNGDLTDSSELQASAGRTYMGSTGVGVTYKAAVVDEGIVTAGVTVVLFVGYNSTGTPAAGLGSAIVLGAESTTTANREQALIAASWTTATDASRAADLTLSAYYTTTAQEGLRIRGNSTSVQIGVFGVTPVARASAYTQNYTAATKTHSNFTASSLTDNSGGTADTTIQALTDPADTPASADALRDDLVANLIPELRNNFADLAAQINALFTDLTNAKRVLNSVIDDLQAYGWFQ